MNFKKLISFAVFILLGHWGFGQANAGEDKTICIGASVEIGTTGDPNSCYKWSPEVGLDDPDSPTPIASPMNTTTYTLTCVGEDITNTTTDQVTVTVEQPMVTLEAENNITECMEGRSVTFTAVASSVFEHDTPIKFTFNYERPDGTPWKRIKWSFDLVEDNTVDAGDVPAGNMNHYFDTPIFVEVGNDDCMGTSNTLSLRIYELWIDYFRDNTTNKNWKVVVGKNIAYNAISSSDCTNWAWDMQDGFPDTWNPIGGNAKSGTTMVIPNSDMPNCGNWADFGSAYGTVDVFCEDGEGNNHCIHSTPDIFCANVMSPEQPVKVFFDRSLLTNNGGNGTEPNWFCYWKEFIPWGLINTLTYDGGLGDYAVTIPHTASTRVGARASEYNDETMHRGIHTFYETLAHESHHIVLWNGWWGAGNLPDPANDVDNDWYPDSWELTNPQAMAHGFAVPQDDHYTWGIIIPGTMHSAGYNYEEAECRNIEHMINEAAYDNNDWSFDPTSTNQGKQW